MQQGAEVLPDALLLGSVLGAFTEDAPVMAAWMEVEKQVRAGSNCLEVNLHVRMYLQHGSGGPVQAQLVGFLHSHMCVHMQPSVQQCLCALDE
jgi:hypothetical protein